MKKEKTYKWVKFTPDVIKKALGELQKYTPIKKKGDYFLESLTLTIHFGTERWTYDDENEFFADYRSNFITANYNYQRIASNRSGSLDIDVSFIPKEPRSDVSVKMPSRSEIEAVFEIFEEALESCSLPKPTPPAEPPWESKVTIFIGHGRNAQWRDLKDHLSDKHGLKVEAYEIGARGGLTIKEVLEEMLTASSFALLVMTGEDEDAKGAFHARENVIHELGLFQGRLGFRKSIVLLEENTAEFSNIQGVNQIRFSKNSIQKTFGEVIATLKREFGTQEK